jgi:inorganic pyrophosphatase
MNLDRVGSGRNLPDDFNVIIEIPMNADPIKYEVDKETGALKSWPAWPATRRRAGSRCSR